MLLSILHDQFVKLFSFKYVCAFCSMLESLTFFFCINDYSFNFREFKFAQTMIFAINEINKNPKMLSSVKLGYKIYDNCGTMDILRAALALVSGRNRELSEDSCTETVQAILGHSGSSPTIALAQVVGRFQIPVVSQRSFYISTVNRKLKLHVMHMLKLGLQYATCLLDHCHLFLYFIPDQSFCHLFLSEQQKRVPNFFQNYSQRLLPKQSSCKAGQALWLVLGWRISCG